MGASLLQAVAALVSRLQRAAKRMGKAKASPVPWRKAFSMPSSPLPARKAGRDAAEGGLWRKEILMGERCQPLDFSGVIYYDAEGRRLAHPPPPRSPMRSPLPASPRLVANVGRRGGLDRDCLTMCL
ncbi:hypothetical protein EJB05_44948, partial [Eragrostis curvula]